jgi:hypothetical protein
VHEAHQQPHVQATSDIFRYATEELCNIATQYATINEVDELRHAPGSREATPSSDKEASFHVAIHDASNVTPKNFKFQIVSKIH